MESPQYSQAYPRDPETIAPGPNRTPLSPPPRAKVSVGQKEALRDLIYRVKTYHSPGEAVTASDLDQFLRKVFLRWSTDEPHSLPSKKTADAGFEDTAVYVGKLSNDLPASKTTKKCRSKADKHRVSKRPGQPKKLLTKSRRARVYPGIPKWDNHSVNFHFVDNILIVYRLSKLLRDLGKDFPSLHIIKEMLTLSSWRRNISNMGVVDEYGPPYIPKQSEDTVANRGFPAFPDANIVFVHLFEMIGIMLFHCHVVYFLLAETDSKERGFLLAATVRNNGLWD